MSIGNWGSSVRNWGSSNNWGSNLNWLFVDVRLSGDFLMDIGLSSNLGINIRLSSDFLMDIGLSSNFLMDIRLSSDLFMDVWLSSWVEVSIGNRGIINSSISSSNWGSSISHWLSSICTSNGGYWLSSSISISIWISIAIIGSWDNSS